MSPETIEALADIQNLKHSKRKVMIPDMNIVKLCEKIYEADHDGIPKLAISIEKAVELADYIVKQRLEIQKIRSQLAKQKIQNANLAIKLMESPEHLPNL